MFIIELRSQALANLLETRPELKYDEEAELVADRALDNLYEGPTSNIGHQIAIRALHLPETFGERGVDEDHLLFNAYWVIKSWFSTHVMLKMLKIHESL